MLVLTRKQQEKIQIGNDITITVLRTKGKAVRLGIEAPQEVAVLRGELCFEDDGDRKAAGDVCASETDVEAESAGQPTPLVATDGGGFASVAAGETHATLHRLRRCEVAQILPGLAGSPAPLRAMLPRRRSGMLT